MAQDPLVSKGITVTPDITQDIKIPSFRTTPPQSAGKIETQILRDLYATLRDAEISGNLDTKGVQLKQFMENGAITPQGFSSYLKGGTANWGDEITGLLNLALNKDKLTELSDVLAGGLKFETEGGEKFDLYGGEPVNISPRQLATGLERISEEQFAEEYPKTALGLEVGGGLTSAYLTRGMFGSPTAVKTIPQLIAQTGLVGGLAGFGAGEGDVRQQATSTILGGATGAGLGFGLGVVQNVGGKTVDWIMSGLRPQTTEQRKQALEKVKNVLEMDFGSVDEALVEFSKVTGKQYTLADLSNNPRMLLDIAKMIPNPNSKKAMDFLKQRNLGMMTRLQNDTTQAFGKRGQLFTEVSAIKAARGNVADKLYKKAFQYQIPVEDELVSILQRPSMQKAYATAVDLANEQGVKLPKTILGGNGRLYSMDDAVIKKLNLTAKDLQDPEKLLDLVNKGAFKQVDKIDTEFMHFLKMGLDDQIFADKSPMTGVGRYMLGAKGETRTKLLNYIDSKNKTYQTARNIFAGDTQVLDSYNLGANVFKKDMLDNPDMVASMIKNMTRSEKEAFRSGAVSSIMNALGGVAEEGEQLLVSSDLAKKFIRDPKRMRVLKETFKDSPKAWDNFKKNLIVESEMFETYTKMFGSQTMPRATAYKQFFGDVYDIDPNLDVIGRVTRVLAQDSRIANEQMAQGVAKEVIDILTSYKGKDLAKVIKELKGVNAPNVVFNLLGQARRGLTSPTVTGQQVGERAFDFQRGYIPNP